MFYPLVSEILAVVVLCLITVSPSMWNFMITNNLGGVFLLECKPLYVCLNFSMLCRNKLPNLQKITKATLTFPATIQTFPSNFLNPTMCIRQTELVPKNSGFSWFLLSPFLIIIMGHERTI